VRNHVSSRKYANIIEFESEFLSAVKDSDEASSKLKFDTLISKYPAFEEYWNQSWKAYESFILQYKICSFVTMGCHSTQRVEGMHASLKLFVTKKSSLESVFEAGKSVQESRMDMNEFENFKHIDRRVPDPLQQAVKECLTVWGFALFKNIYKNALASVVLPDGDGCFFVKIGKSSSFVNLQLRHCTCMFKEQYLLPCVHLVSLAFRFGDASILEGISSRWLCKTLSEFQSAFLNLCPYQNLTINQSNFAQPETVVEEVDSPSPAIDIATSLALLEEMKAILLNHGTSFHTQKVKEYHRDFLKAPIPINEAAEISFADPFVTRGRGRPKSSKAIKPKISKVIHRK
jgi:hypothetical protein